MLVRITFGAKSGQVCDLLPDQARAMLADGRATLPDAVDAPVSPVLTEQVASRMDRGLPPHKQRRTR